RRRAAVHHRRFLRNPRKKQLERRPSVRAIDAVDAAARELAPQLDHGLRLASRLQGLAGSGGFGAGRPTGGRRGGQRRPGSAGATRGGGGGGGGVGGGGRRGEGDAGGRAGRGGPACPGGGGGGCVDPPSPARGRGPPRRCGRARTRWTAPTCSRSRAT